jgi:glycosyltransferase involved in cell wall biosynthesis
MWSYGVAIPAFNAAETIGETLASVLAQSVPPAAIVVVDDGSTDKTAQIAAGFGPAVEVIRQANSGPGAAASLAMASLRTDLIATVDADDLWLEDKMEKQIAAMQADRAIDALFCRQRQFRHGATDRTAGEERDGLNRSSMLIHRRVFETVGWLIDPPGNRGDMVDWLARAREAGFRLEMLPEVLVLRRIIPGSLSHGRDSAKDRGYLMVARRAMERRKAMQKASEEPQ